MTQMIPHGSKLLYIVLTVVEEARVSNTVRGECDGVEGGLYVVVSCSETSSMSKHFQKVPTSIRDMEWVLF